MIKDLTKNSWVLILFIISIGISDLMDPKINWIPLLIHLLIIVFYFYVFKLHKRKTNQKS
ncbi:hypothetical protein D3C71_70450 [compost metagenome]